MHNLFTVIQFELIRTLKKPSFWISVLATPALLAFIFGIIIFSQKTSDATQAEINKKPFSLIVMDETKLISDTSIKQLNATRADNKQLAINKVSSAEVDAFFYYPKDAVKNQIEVYNKNDGLTANDKYTLVAKNLLISASTNAIDAPELLSIAKGNINVNQKSYEKGKEINLVGSMIAPAIFLVIFYSVIVLLGNQMLASTTEEKENRVTEMLLTSLSSKTLIVGKIASLVALGFIQIITILTPVVFVYLFARERLNIPDISNFTQVITIEFWPVFIGAGLLVSGFLLFTGLLVGIGAASPTAKEANSFFGVIILIMFIPFYFFSLLMSPEPSIVISILSYFPLTAPVTLMTRNAFGTIGINEALIGLAVVFISGVVAINIAIQIFRYGTLEYSKRLSLRSIFKPKNNVIKSK
ncbi:sodium transporter [Candidatus Saccharibacteria bacterium HGW-Saccharibacteria-1]|jgi:ABC-2 type transport system permease protein|nr:MAG: sodium transporter [Candidatus Saccharibacteria bacterium HGW-Saccharibacteria-1]